MPQESGNSFLALSVTIVTKKLPQSENFAKKIITMFRNLLLAILFSVTAQFSFTQATFDYTLDLQPVNVPNLPGLHSFAYAQHNGKWLVLGGRKDGLHARQPFAAFVAAQSNTDIYVIDVNTKQFWTASVNTLPTGLKEQLQSTNMNFFQDGDSLYIVGGYAFSASSNGFVTFPYLTSVSVPEAIDAVMNATSIGSVFRQITDTAFAVTGGHLGKIGDTFYLIGGQKFTGAYNPMGNPTYTQAYTNQIRKFKIQNSSQLSFSDYSTISDPIHLHRRDYNLLPQIFPNGEEGYTISSGVFQIGADLPFLYPVDITANGHTPITSFSQYLSHYHSAYACLYDSGQNAMHSLFFGGMSQYYYQNGSLMQDNLVPFVKTISRVSRDAAGNLQEYQLPLEMPALKGASAELIVNHELPHYNSDIVKLSNINSDTILIGHILGGIQSSTINPFSVNQTGNTSAASSIYAVRLIRNTTSTGEQAIDGSRPFSINVSPNPSHGDIRLTFDAKASTKVNYYLTNALGQIIKEGQLNNIKNGKNQVSLTLDSTTDAQFLELTVVFDDKFYETKTILLK